MITTDRDMLNVRFEAPWTVEKHALFIRTKKLPEMVLDYDQATDSYNLRAPARFAHMLGLQKYRPSGEQLPIAEFLWDYQRWIMKSAIAAKRYAIWADCGLGKTPMQLEWARQVHSITGGKVLILAPREVCHQTIDEASKFYGQDLQIRWLPSRETLVGWLRGSPEYSYPEYLAITNYEKLIPGVLDEMRWLAGLVADESSILKGGGGVIKWNLIKSARGIEYKLSCTATPAPNDTMEYASQAAFLEKLRTEGEILWTYFMRDPKTNAWKVKPHAREAFYRFMSSWSIYLRKPSAYGFGDPFAEIPEPEIIEVKVIATPEQSAEAHKFWRAYDPDALIPQERLGVTQRAKLSQLAKGFIYEVRDIPTPDDDPFAKPKRARAVRRVQSLKPRIVAELVAKGLSLGKQVLVWTVFDEESLIVADMLTGEPIRTIHGSDPEDYRLEVLDRFRRGEIRCLISKAQLLGYGLNFPFVTWMVFSGFDDSMERFYQAVRRAYRYGSREQLKVFVPYVPGLENHIWDNVLRKKRQWEADVAQQEQLYAEALKQP